MQWNTSAMSYQMPNTQLGTFIHKAFASHLISSRRSHSCWCLAWSFDVCSAWMFFKATAGFTFERRSLLAIRNLIPPCWKQRVNPRHSFYTYLSRRRIHFVLSSHFATEQAHYTHTLPQSAILWETLRFCLPPSTYRESPVMGRNFWQLPLYGCRRRTRANNCLSTQNLMVTYIIE